MAFVIFSAGALAQSRTRTVSARFVVVALSCLLLLVLGGGVALGYVFHSRVNIEAPFEPIVLVEPAPTAPAVPEFGADSRVLIDRFGELSGRMIQLEAEAMDLAFRIGVIKEFEARLTPAEREVQARGRLAKTPPGPPSGGPLLRQEAELPPGPGLQRADDDPAPLSDELVRMQDDVTRLAEVLADLDEVVVSLNMAYMSFPGRPPVAGNASTSSFGNRLDPFTKRKAFHSGVDFPAPKGTPIFASAGGRVIFADYRRHYGNTVEILHGAGLVSRYAHASKLNVRVGQVVMPGEEIARVGSTGRSTGPHLHFEILKDGRFVDPSIYLARF